MSADDEDVAMDDLPKDETAAREVAEEEEEEDNNDNDRPDPASAYCQSVLERIQQQQQQSSSHNGGESSSGNDPSSSSHHPSEAEAEEEEEMERTKLSHARRDSMIALREASMREILQVGARKTVLNESQLDSPAVVASRKSIAEEGGQEEEGKEEEGKAERRSSASKKKGSKIGVFNANSPEGCSIVRTLAKQGCEVVAVVRVTTSRNVRRMVRLPNVTVVVADSLHDREALADAIRGCAQVFYVLKYWEKFDGALEETQTFTVFDSCYLADVSWVVFTTYEEVTELKRRGKKSQIVPRSDGTVAMPSFAGLKKARSHADDRGIRVTHMITSYIDSKKRSLTLIKGGEKLIVVSNK